MTFVVLRWNHFGRKISYLYWGAKNWTQNSPVLSARITFLRLLATFHLPRAWGGPDQPVVPWIFLVAHLKDNSYNCFFYNILSCSSFFILQFKGRNTDIKEHYKNKFVCLYELLTFLFAWGARTCHVASVIMPILLF